MSIALSPLVSILQPENVVKAELESEIFRAISDGINVFISGMARGVDIWAAEIVLRLRSEGQPIKLICANPYDGFERAWPAGWQQSYINIIWTS